MNIEKKFLFALRNYSRGWMLLFLLTLLLVSGCNKEKDTTEKDLKLTDSIGCVEWKAEEITDSSFSDLSALSEVHRCGTLNMWAGPFPKSLNMWLDYNSFSAEVMQLLFTPLAGLHPQKNERVGFLASRWEVSKDQKEFTFHINPLARWSDGQPVTASDVQFYYDVLMDPQNMTPIFKVDLKRFERPIVVDSLTVKVIAKEYHWKNFLDVAGFFPFPKHHWQGKDFNKIHYDFEVTNGPYKVGSLKKDRSLLLQRDEKWWGDKLLFNKNKYNFSKLRYRFMEDRTKALEALKKGDFDLLPIYTASLWAQQTQFDQVQKNWIVRQQIYNNAPIGFQGLAINLRREKFKDIRVRQALAHLLNREQMNEKLMFNAYFLLNSYYPDLYPQNVNPAQEQMKYDPDKARELLKEAGYMVDDQGLLKKNGKTLSIVFYSAATDLRHLTIYLEDLKKVGIQASIEKMTWSTIRKKLDDHDFDMYWAAWGSSRLKDPEGIWSSNQIDEKGTNNIPGFGDPQVDQWIDELKSVESIAVRDSLVKRIDQILVKQIPYILLWQNDNTRLLYWNRFKTPEKIFSKFGGSEDAIVYWSYDPAKENALSQAQQKNSDLPANPGVIHY